MPSGKKLRAAKPETSSTADEEHAHDDEETPVDEVPLDDQAPVEEAPADESPADEAPAADAPVEDAPAKKRARWKLSRRAKNQPAEDSSPVTGEAADAQTSTEAPAEAAATPEAQDPSTPEAQDPPTPDAVPAAQEPVLVAHQPAGKRLKTAAVAAAVLFVAGGAFLGATAQPVIANNALVETKLTIARTAANAITTLWSYTPENMDTLGERSARYLTGDFAFQYKKFIDSIAATNKQAQVTNTTSVLGTAVESVNQTDASAIVYTNSIATSPVSKNIPSLRYLSYRLEMKRDHSDWRITRMTTITTLDLTPQL